MRGAGSLAAAIKPMAAQTATTPAMLRSPSAAKDLVQAAIDDLSKIGSVTPATDPLVKDSLKRAQDFKTELEELIDKGKLTEDALSQLSARIEKAKIDNPNGNLAAQTINQFYKQAQNEIEAAIKALKEGIPPKPDFRLFEIRMEGGKTKLIPVDMGAAVAGRFR